MSSEKIRMENVKRLQKLEEKRLILNENIEGLNSLYLEGGVVSLRLETADFNSYEMKEFGVQIIC